MQPLTPRIRWIAVASLAAAAALALGVSAGFSQERPRIPQTPATAEIEELRIAFVERLGTNAAEDRVLPALHGAELALDAAGNAGEPAIDVELVRVDPWREPERFGEIVEDPGVVAAIGAPYLSGQLWLGERLDRAGLPFVTLSAYGPDLSSNGWLGWFRVVADVDDEAAALVGWLDDSTTPAADVCLAGDGSPGTVPFLEEVAGRLDGRVAARVRMGPDLGTGELVARVRRAGCHVVVWGGDGDNGGTVAASLHARGARASFAGGSNLRDPAFAEAAGRAARGAISASSSADLTAETRLAAQRFVQDYQSRFARPPGPYAVEAWDAAGWLLRAIDAGGVARAGLVERLRALTPFEGLAGTYDFSAEGEPVGDAATVTLWRLGAGRWATAD